ncbi:MAG: hypothetical protein KBA06_01645 [Saprospiraceae bacterium]|nr:hypothetical protein [Saprospiraceae bacterium]
MKKLVYFFAFTCMVLLNSFVVSAQESVYVHPSIKQALLRTSKVDIIILFKEQADLSLAKSIHGKDAKATFVYNALKTTCSTSQKNVIALLNSRNIPFESHYLINGIKTNVNQELLNLLSQRNDIKAIYLDSPIKIEIPKREISTGQSRGPSSVEWGLSMIQADSVWNMGITGEGAVIAGEDTGYDWTHPAIQKNIEVGMKLLKLPTTIIIGEMLYTLTAH